MLKIYVVPQQHWDPSYTFGPEISEKMGVRNVRQALDIIRDNPEFKYVIGQVYLFDLFKKYYPERVDELKQRVKEGRIELACGGYVNPDFNLPSGESLIRQLSFCQKTWQEEFGKKPEVCWIQDSFGQSGQLPQIFKKLGIKYHTAKRGAKAGLPANFIWEGVDGSQIIFDRQPLGHHGIALFPPFSCIPNRENPDERLEKKLRPFFLPLALIALYLPDFTLWTAVKGSFWRFKSALKHLAKYYSDNEIFVPHGFGFDGALPVGYVTYLCKIYSKLSRNEMFIALPSDFFQKIEKNKDKLMVIKGELNGPHRRYGEASGALPGTYSTRIEVKQQARQAERLLYLAELLETMKYLAGGEYQDLTELWKLKFLCDFHDGICGSLTDDNYKILQEKSYKLRKDCQRIVSEDLELLSVSQSVFNPLPWSRKDLIERNKKVELVESGPMGFCQIKTLKPQGVFGFNLETKVLFTPFYKANFENNNLEIYELIPRDGGGKKTGRKITGEKFARFRLQQENGDAYFWDVLEEEWDEVKSIKVIECNNLRAILEIKSKVRGLEIAQQIYFYPHTPRIDFKVKLQNQEKNIRLQAHLPLVEKIEENIREIPAGFIKDDESPGQSKWKDVCGQKFAYYDNIKCAGNWVYFPLVSGGAAIFNEGLPEHEIVGNSCYLTLLRCVGTVGIEGKGLKKFRPDSVPWRAGSPHPIPLAQEQGEHEFRYAFCPCPKEDVVRRAYEFLFPLIFCDSKMIDGDNKEKSCLFSVSDKNVIPLAVKRAERKEGIIIRLLETEGRDREVEIKFGSEINFKSVKITDLMEEKISDVVIDGGVVKLHFCPQEIITILLER